MTLLILFRRDSCIYLIDEVWYADRLSDKCLDIYCGKHLSELFII